MAFTPGFTSFNESYSPAKSRSSKRARRRTRGFLTSAAGLSVALTAAWALADARPTLGPVLGWQVALPICAPASAHPNQTPPVTIPEVAFGEGYKLFNVIGFVCPEGVTAAQPSSRLGVRQTADLMSGQPTTMFELPAVAPSLGDALTDNRLRAQGSFQLLIPRQLTSLLNRVGATIPNGVVALVLQAQGRDGTWSELGRYTETLLRGDAVSYTWALETPGVPAGTPLKLSVVLHLADAAELIAMLPAALQAQPAVLNPVFVLRDARLFGTAHFSTNQPTVNP